MPTMRSIQSAAGALGALACATLVACGGAPKQVGGKEAPPPVPADLRAVGNADGSRVQLTWTASPGAISYTIHRGADGGAKGTLTDLPSSTFTDLDPGAGHTFTYSVAATGPSGSSSSDSPDVTVTLVPPKPIALAADASAGTSVLLTWKIAFGAASYAVGRGTSSAGPFPTLPGGDAVTGTTYKDTTVTPGTTYYYVLTASSAAGTSPRTDPVLAAP